MAVLKDYLKWRGDLEFWQDGFNDYDNLVFSNLSYIEMSEIFEQEQQEVLALSLIAEKFPKTEAYQLLTKDKSLLKGAAATLEAVGKSKRYEKVYVRNYVSRFSEERTLQFSAMEFLLPDGVSYVAFRGTDDTIIGWKEDFMLAVTEVQAEKEAVAYLNWMASNSTRPLRLGGHSKGGHLAIYAGALCYKEIQDRILKVYDNDGPGFTGDFLEEEGLKAIESRIERFIPEGSVIGKLMNTIGHETVVKSSNKLIMQHDLLSWKMDGMKFDTVDSVSKSMTAVDTAINQWVNDFQDDEKVAFINDLFSVFEAAGVNTVSEMQEGGVKTLLQMTKQMNSLSEDTKKKIGEIINGMFKGLIH